MLGHLVSFAVGVVTGEVAKDPRVREKARRIGRECVRALREGTETLGDFFKEIEGELAPKAERPRAGDQPPAQS